MKRGEGVRIPSLKINITRFERPYFFLSKRVLRVTKKTLELKLEPFIDMWYTKYRKKIIKKPTYSELLWRVTLEVGDVLYPGLL